jgi:hypothetical protein
MIESQTAGDVARRGVVELAMARIFGDGRFFRSLISKMFEVWSFASRRSVATQAGCRFVWTEQLGQSKRPCGGCPVFRGASRQSGFLALGQSYYFEGISAQFSEERAGAFRASGAELGRNPSPKAFDRSVSRRGKREQRIWPALI